MFLFPPHEQVNRCSSAGASNKSRQTKIAHALAKSFQGFQHKLFCLTGFGFVTFVARCTVLSSRQPILSFKQLYSFRFLDVTLHFIRYATSFHSSQFSFTHFSHFQSTGYQLFSSPAQSFGLRAFLFFLAIKICNKNALVLLSCGMPFCLPPLGEMQGAFCHTCNIVCIRFRTSSSHAAHPLSTRRWLAAQRIANHFVRTSLHFLQPFSFPRRGRFYHYIPIDIYFKNRMY